MSVTWSGGLSKAIATLIAEIIIQLIIEDNIITKLKSELVQRRVLGINEISLEETYISSPGIQTSNDPVMFTDFLRNARVSREFGKLAHPADHPYKTNTLEKLRDC